MYVIKGMMENYDWATESDAMKAYYLVDGPTGEWSDNPREAHIFRCRADADGGVRSLNSHMGDNSCSVVPYHELRFW